MRTLLAVALLLMLGVVCVDAAETIGLFKNVTLISQTLDGTVLDARAVASATAAANVLLQRCTVQGAGLTVNGTTEYWAAGPNAITLRILDATVKDATLAFRNYLPNASLVSIVNMTATMEGSTPLFDLQGFYLGWTYLEDNSFSVTIQRVRATWGTGDGGSVVQVGGRYRSKTMSSQIFSLSEAVVTGAAHVLEITSECFNTDCLQADSGSLIAFDLIEFRDARGAFIYSNSTAITFSSKNSGMIRFSNITMTGCQPFFDVRDGRAVAFSNDGYGSMMFSAISNDGPLFALAPRTNTFVFSGNVKYSFRHINVASVMSDVNSYTANVPNSFSMSDETWYCYMGNITVAGKLVKTIAELETNQLFATQLVGAYGEVLEVRQDGYWAQPSLRTAAAVNCVIGRDGNAAFVPLANGVQRAECNCNTTYNTPYCTTAVDPLVYYDAYSPSPATCDVANCDTCLFGQTSQCGACALGYGLTNELGCDRIPCSTPNCSDCTTDDVCVSCADSYVLTVTCTCAKCTASHCNQCASPGDGIKCAACADGYKPNDKGQCKKTGTPWWVWLIVGIAAAAVFAGAIVLLVCCLRRRKVEESASSVRATSNNAMRRDQSDATEMQQYGSVTSAGAAPPNRSAPSGAYPWSFDDFNARCSTQGSRATFGNPFDYDYQLSR